MTAWTGYDEPTIDGWNVTVAVSPDLDAYAAGEIDASQVRCLMCQAAPCECEGQVPVRVGRLPGPPRRDPRAEVGMNARLARATTVVTVTAVAALPVTAGCVIGHAYLAATAALLLSAVTGACGWVLVGRHDTPGTSTAVHPAEREGDRISHTG